MRCCSAGKSHDSSNSMLISPLHSNFSLWCRLTFQWQPLGLSVLLYFVSANTLFSEIRTHSPSPPHFQVMWASTNFNSPSHLAAVTRNAFVGHWVADKDFDWLAPIMSSYMLCMTKTGKVVYWDIQMDTCLAKLNPGWAWSLMEVVEVQSRIWGEAQWSRFSSDHVYFP